MFKKIKIAKIFWWMLLFIPLSVYFAFFTSNTTLTFITAALAIIPLAIIIGYTTKEIAIQTNPTIGGLVSATFGNIIELIIAFLALQKGLILFVQASLIGSIVANILLLIGLSIFFGGLKYKEQKFNKAGVGVSSTMLIIAVVGLTIPSVYAFINPTHMSPVMLSTSVAIILALTYIAGLIFSLKTHRDLFDASDEIKAAREKPTMKKKTAAMILFAATVVVALVSGILVNVVEPAAKNLGVAEVFIGFVLIAIITNIAEKTTAVKFALENKLDVSLEIGLSSAIQIALFVVPILVLASSIFGYGFSLVFSIFEVIAMFLAVMIVNYLSADGRCNWLEGAQLISVYLIIAVAFLFV